MSSFAELPCVVCDELFWTYYEQGKQRRFTCSDECALVYRQQRADATSLRRIMATRKEFVG